MDLVAILCRLHITCTDQDTARLGAVALALGAFAKVPTPEA